MAQFELNEDQLDVVLRALQVHARTVSDREFEAIYFMDDVRAKYYTAEMSLLKNSYKQLGGTRELVATEAREPALLPIRRAPGIPGSNRPTAKSAVVHYLNVVFRGRK